MFRKLTRRKQKDAEPETGKRPRLRFLILLSLAFVVCLAVAGLAVMRLRGSDSEIDAFALPYVQDFHDVNISRWLSRSGVWSIRNEALAQTANLDKAGQLFIPRVFNADQQYHLSAHITLSRNGRAAGIDFNTQNPGLEDKTHRVVISRAPQGLSAEMDDEEAMELVAGYTDDQGDFVPQVTVPFTTATQEYRLDIYVLGNTYLVQLNGQTLIEKRPLFYPSGLIGFYSLGPATFDTIKLTTAESDQPGEMTYASDFDQVPGGAGWVPFDGEWQISENELVQANPAAPDAGIGYEGSAFENYVVQASFRHLVGVGGGILFNMPSPYQLNGSYMVRYSDQTDALFWGYFDETGAFVRQGFEEVAAPGQDLHQIRVYSGQNSYDIFLDGQLIARDVLLAASEAEAQPARVGGHIGLITSRSSVAFSLVEAFPLLGSAPAAGLTLETESEEQPPGTPTPTGEATATITPPAATPSPSPTVSGPTATPLPADSGLVVAGSATEFQADFGGDFRTSGWKPINGRWRFENGDLIQEETTGFDQSIVYTANAYRNFTLDVTFMHREGHGAGLLFNMPNTGRLNGSHMVRYSDRRPGGIFWGYYDASGKFVGQGYANVDPPGESTHGLRIVSADSTYNIYLDGTLLADNLPLQQNYGYIGLITAQSSAVYSGVQIGDQLALPSGSAVAAIPTRQPAASSADDGFQGFDDQQVIDGNWVIEDGVYRQTVPDPADYILNTGIYAANYTAEAEILLPDRPEIGAGFVIHMPERSLRAGAYLVRLIRGGQGIFWGSYDQAGAFRGKGSAELPENPEGVYRLRLEVRDNVLAIFVNDEEIASDLLIPRTEGWIGLLAHGGIVTFRNVEITVGLGQ